MIVFVFSFWDCQILSRTESHFLFPACWEHFLQTLLHGHRASPPAHPYLPLRLLRSRTVLWVPHTFRRLCACNRDLPAADVHSPRASWVYLYAHDEFFVSLSRLKTGPPGRPVDGPAGLPLCLCSMGNPLPSARPTHFLWQVVYLFPVCPLLKIMFMKHL